jgi:WD40 repeat protein
MGTPSVYISSTFEDLKEYRAAVFEALEKALFLVGRMEGYAASDERPLKVCLQDVESRDIYVGIFAWRYGYIPPKEHGNLAGLSITECEYRHALAKNKPTLCFFHDPKAVGQWPDRFKDEVTGQGDAGARIQSLRNEVGTEKMGNFFGSPYELAANVLAAVVRRGTARRPFNVPSVPRGFIPRPEIIRKAVTALVDEKKTPLAIHGAGGFGKTALATALCHEPEVIQDFPDGIVWITLGEKNPEVERKLADIYAALTGNRPATTTVVGIAAEVRENLSGKRCLIVADDVWSNADLAPFRNLGAHRLIFTTRKRELAGGCPQIEIKEMTTEESFQLLVRGMPEAASHQTAVEDFARRLRGWALLLELANARLRLAREHLSDFKVAFDYVVDVYLHLGVTGFDPGDAKERNEAVVKCLEAGLEAFEKNLPALKVQAGELALFPEDVPTPEQALCELWGLDEFAVKEKTLRPLHDLSIVTWDPQERTVRLHNLLRAALRTWVPDGRAGHRRLLDSWRDPLQLPHEYAWRWYGWHCLEAADSDRLRELLLSPAWLKAKLEHTEAGALVADCERLVSEQQIARRGLEIVGPKAAGSSGPDPTIRLLGDALRNSAHVMARARSQLCDQLLGRLRPGVSPELDKLRDQLLRDPGRQKLRARFANLEPAGSPRLRTLAGHGNSVLGALLLPAGKRALSWSFDRTLRLWDLEMGNQIGDPLAGHEWAVNGALLLPDGKRALSWSDDTTIRLWDLETGKQLGEPFLGHDSAVNGALLLPTRKRAFSWSRDKTMRLWDLETGKQTGEPLTGHKHGANGALLLPDGKRALSWSDDTTMRLWDLETGQQVGNPLIGHESCVIGALLLPCGTVALSWSLDKTLRLWDLETGKQTGEPLARHEDFVNGALLLPDGKRALSWSDDGTLQLSHLENQQLVGATTIGLHIDGALSLPDGNRVLLWFSDATLRVWDLENWQQVGAPLRSHGDAVYGALLLPGGKRVLSWSRDGTLRLWDLETEHRSSWPIVGHEFAIYGAVHLKDSKRVLSWSGDGTLRLWELETGQEVGTPLKHKESVLGALLLPDEKQVLSWSEDRTLRLWDTEKSHQIGVTLMDEKAVDGALLLPDGKRALSWSHDNTLRLWDVEKGRQVGAALTGHEASVFGALLLPEGKRALSWSEDGTLRLWDLETGKQLNEPLTGHDDWVTGALLLPEGKRALSRSVDGTLRLWQLDTGQQIGPALIGHGDAVYGALLLPDGKRALSWSRDGTLRLWNLEAGQQVAPTLAGHKDAVHGALPLPDGKRALSWSDDGTLRQWDLETGQQAGAALTGHDDRITGVVLLGKNQALSWSDDWTLRLWDLSISSELARFYAEGRIECLIDCGNNRFFAGDGTGRVYFLELVES